MHEATESAVFLSFAGTRLTSGTLYVLVKGHARAPGLAVSPHGADVRHIQALLSHSQLQTTAIYTRVAMETCVKRSRARIPGTSGPGSAKI